MFLIYNLLFSLIYYFTKDNFSDMKSFLDAFYYSLNVSTTLGYGDIVPTTNTGKIITMIHGLIVYFSASKFFFQTQGNFLIFAFANAILIAGMTYAYKQFDSTLGKSNVDYAYFATITHTTIGFGDHKKPLDDKTKMLVMAHVLFIFLLLNTYNGGIFSMMKNMIFRQ